VLGERDGSPVPPEATGGPPVPLKARKADTPVRPVGCADRSVHSIPHVNSIQSVKQQRAAH